MRAHVNVLAAITVALMTSPLAAPAAAAAAATSGPVGWEVTDSSGGRPAAADAPPQTNSLAPAALPQDDLKNSCREQHASAASTQQGWMADRFNRCWIGHRKVVLRCLDCTTMIASVEFDYTLIGIAQNGSRKVDFYLSFDNWKALGGEERVTTPMRVSLTGCGSLVSCNPGNAEVTQPLGEWQAVPSAWITMTSPDGTGAGADYRVPVLVQLGMAILPVDPTIVPWVENDMTTGDVRFDSAGAVAGKFNGTVFADFAPTYDLLAIARADGNEAGVQESIQHIDDALHHPERTWPSFIGKGIPGEYVASLGQNQHPLHRLVDSTLNGRNRTYAGYVCADVWGPGAVTPNLNCDEYPMASTQEGAYTGSSAAGGDTNGWQRWNGSSRIIGEVDNQDSGRKYLNIGFYQPNRILDGDAFYVAVNR
ncbi:NucA/NucB deoxyribonuclease domain-containing protein [Actinoplanes sp. NPDC049316]|uniref:NucA/NucB deoxyribonuclease domain-containing protein n=1 Tax=Actinoplanes sp. NPDC049316 TaxID=3154727 RepID=UPI003420082C